MTNGKKIRAAQLEDLDEILEIYTYAKKFMVETGNPTQWVGNYPQRELLEEDIANQGLFVVTEAKKICGVFYFVIGPDPTYAIIENGAWHSDQTYGTIHRIAGNGNGGVFGAALDYCRSQMDYLRIDTHGDNVVMQNLLKGLGFVHCGTVYVEEDEYPRLAFEKTNISR